MRSGADIAAGDRGQAVAREEIPLPRGRVLRLQRVPAVMGILNATPDSFSDGGLHLSPRSAIEAGLRMVEAGAAIVDVGGESTRPGSDPVPAPVEIDRVLPIIEAIRRSSDVAISVDTMKHEVARAALAAGADMVNDVSGFRHDPAIAGVTAASGAAAVLMHMRGAPKTMQQEIHFDDLIGEIRSELRERVDDAVAAGIPREQILVDPGIGFGKDFEHNLEILRRAAEFTSLAPLVIGASRKAFVGHLTGRPPGPERVAGSLAAVAAAYRARAAVVRVHDVAEAVDFLKVYHAIAERSG
jgi:dihydropteroate synthase